MRCVFSLDYQYLRETFPKCVVSKVFFQKQKLERVVSSELQFPQSPPESTDVVIVSCFGRYMVTSGMDKKLKVYDIRAFKPLKSYFLPAGASCLSLSQRGLLSAATGDIVQVIITSTLHCDLSLLLSVLGFN